jgi:carboxylesterase
MVQRIIKFAEKAVEKAKGIIFADPRLLYEKERHLLNQPFFFEGTNGKGVMLVHGWTSTPYEVRRLGKYLNENGYTVLGIQLSGHGTVPRDLENVSWQDWIQDIKKGYAKLKETCPKVFIAGTSIGASLTMIFAKEKPEISGLVLMATPYKIKFEKLVELWGEINILFKRYNRKFYPPTFGSRTTITRLISYQTYPIKSALEVFKLVREARKNIDKIKQPCFIIQSTHDHIVEKESLENIYAQIGSEVKRKKYISKAYHTFISDVKNEHVFENICSFINEN